MHISLRSPQKLRLATSSQQLPQSTSSTRPQDEVQALAKEAQDKIELQSTKSGKQAVASTYLNAFQKSETPAGIASGLVINRYKGKHSLELIKILTQALPAGPTQALSQIFLALPGETRQGKEPEHLLSVLKERAQPTPGEAAILGDDLSGYGRPELYGRSDLLVFHDGQYRNSLGSTIRKDATQKNIEILENLAQGVPQDPEEATLEVLNRGDKTLALTRISESSKNEFLAPLADLALGVFESRRFEPGVESKVFGSLVDEIQEGASNGSSTISEARDSMRDAKQVAISELESGGVQSKEQELAIASKNEQLEQKQSKIQQLEQKMTTSSNASDMSFGVALVGAALAIGAAVAGGPIGLAASAAFGTASVGAIWNGAREFNEAAEAGGELLTELRSQAEDTYDELSALREKSISTNLSSMVTHDELGIVERRIAQLTEVEAQAF